jgi:hypothetical protein
MIDRIHKQRRPLSFILALLALLLLLRIGLLGLTPQSTQAAFPSPSRLTNSARSIRGEIIANIGGGFSTIQVRDNIAYVGEGAALTIFDVSDPQNPQRLASVPVSYYVNDIELDGDFAYLAASYLEILDIRDPRHPKLINTPPVTADEGVEVVNGYAFIVGYQHFGIVDVRDPFDTQLIQQYDTDADRVSDIQIVDNLAYILTSKSGRRDHLEILDVSTPTQPVSLGSYEELGWAHQLRVEDRFAYIADRTFGLQIVDVSQPQQPKLHGSYTSTTSYPLDILNVELLEDRAYLATFTGLLELDIQDPSDPVLLHRHTQLVTSDVHVDGELLYVADIEGLFITRNASNAFEVLHRYPSILSPVNMERVGEHLYIADENQLAVLDVSTPENPTLLAHYKPDANFSVRNFEIVEERVYLKVENTLHILDVSDPASPRFLGKITSPYLSFSFHVEGELVYLVGGLYGLWSETNEGRWQIIDVSDPANPQLLQDVSLPGAGMSITLYDGYAYLVYLVKRGEFGDTYKTQIVDVRDPTQAPLLNTLDTPIEGRVVGDELYSTNILGFTIFDLSTPLTPTLVGEYRSTSSTRVTDIEVQEDLVYRSVLRTVEIVDVSDPSQPRLVSTLDAIANIDDIELAGDILYISRMWGGFLTMRLSEGFPLFFPIINSDRVD